MIKTVRIMCFACMGLTGCSSSTITPASKTLPHSYNFCKMEFVRLPGGTFSMGSDKSVFSRPVHLVTLDSFEIMATEVTNTQYELFQKRIRSPESQLDQGPVCGIKRKDVLRFIDWLSARDNFTYGLPTEAQWEYAARGGLENMDFPWGNDLNEKLAKFEGNSAVAVKSFPANNFGLYDMCGNVAEMCWGYPFKYPDHPVRNPRGELALDNYASRGSGIGRPLSPWIWLPNIESDSEQQIPGLGFRLVRWKDNNSSKDQHPK